MLTKNELLPNCESLKDMQILVVDNDRDSRDLYTFLLEVYGAKVTTYSSIKDALNFLNFCLPGMLICEMRFLGESVDPLIQQVRELARRSGQIVPILVTSTYSLTSLVQQLTMKVETYLLKPVDIDHFVHEVWHLTLLSNIVPTSGWLEGRLPAAIAHSALPSHDEALMNQPL